LTGAIKPAPFRTFDVVSVVTPKQNTQFDELLLVHIKADQRLLEIHFRNGQLACR